MNRLLVAVASLVFSANIYAGCNTKSCSGAIERIYINDNVTYIKMKSDMSSLNCSLVSGSYISLRNSQGNRDLMFSTLLAAQASGSTGITIRISEGTSDCKIAYVLSDS